MQRGARWERRGSGGGVSKSGGAAVEEEKGVNFDMSFLKLSFDNWQFVRLVKCQESKKIDEVHNRCLRLTLRCGRRVPRTHQTTETILKWDGNTNTHGRSRATHTHTLDCRRAPPIRKPLGVNLVAGDVICAWTRRCHSNGGGRWLRACRFIRMLSCCNGACRSINETTLRKCCFLFSSAGVFCIIWSYSRIPPSTSENTGRRLYFI